MHDIKAIRANPASFATALLRRDPNWDTGMLLDNLFALDDARKAAIAHAQAAQQRRNEMSAKVGEWLKNGDTTVAHSLRRQMADTKEEIAVLGRKESEANIQLQDALSRIPNLPLDDVPDGADEKDNVVLREEGIQPAFPTGFAPKQHFDIGYGMDFEAGARLSGSRFVVLRGKMAQLERALTQFMLDLHTMQHGYEEVAPPLMVREQALFGTAQLPKFREDLFSTNRNDGDGDRHWLIPTAEVPLTNLVADQIVAETELPMRLTAATTCFRAEAGSAGRDTRGLIRQHQFVKVELVSITTPDRSLEELGRMTKCAEAVLRQLGLPYRVVELCAGDMGFAARKTYDLEVWMPGQGSYREISSCSICGDFQARRMNARYRASGGARFVHTLNGSGVAVGRCLAAILENYQHPDGSVSIPEALRAYMGGQARLF